MTDPSDGSKALAADDPTFAATVIEETRALIKQVTAWACEQQTTMATITVDDSLDGKDIEPPVATVRC